MSCAAKDSGIVIVANLVELADGNIYNCDVAFDEKGAFLAKYRKMNVSPLVTHALCACVRPFLLARTRVSCC